MKSIESIYNEIKASKELQEKLAEAAKASKVEEFFKEQGCDAELSEIMAYAKGNMAVELDDDELDNVAGGFDWVTTLMSVVSAGTACAAIALMSACGEGVGEFDANSDETCLCKG